MRILVACEESQEVCKAFRAMGHEAYSCDIEPCSVGHPEWHLKCDALELLKIQWDLALADREKRCVVMPGKPGDKFLYKSAAGFWCNAVIKDYMPKNIFITAETEIPNAEPLSHTFSISEVEAELQRDKK